VGSRFKRRVGVAEERGVKPPAANATRALRATPAVQRRPPRRARGASAGSVDPAVRAAVDAERARVRAWLHDSTLQVLEYLASGGYVDEPEARELQRIAGDAASELRAFVDGASLGDDRAVRGRLCEQLRAVVTEARRGARHDVGLVFGALDETLAGEAASELAAAAAEALRNARKHARATRALVSCDVAGGVATVSVSDDGVGFDSARTPRGTGLRESVAGRVERLGGSVEIRSRPGHGTRVTLLVPLGEDTDGGGPLTSGAERADGRAS
jgi:signal transduction histidine kinase